MWTKVTVEGVWEWIWGDKGARQGPDLQLIAAAEEKAEHAQVELRGLDAHLDGLEQRARQAKALTEKEAIAELRKNAGRDASEGARGLYKDLRSFVSSARRDGGKLAKALERDFQQAQKRVTARKTATRSRASSTSRTAKSRGGASRSQRKTS